MKSKTKMTMLAVGLALSLNAGTVLAAEEGAPAEEKPVAAKSAEQLMEQEQYRNRTENQVQAREMEQPKAGGEGEGDQLQTREKQHSMEQQLEQTRQRTRERINKPEMPPARPDFDRPSMPGRGGR